MFGKGNRSVTRMTPTAILVLAVTTQAFGAVPGGNGKVVYESNRSGGFDLYTVEADGSGTAVLAALTAMDRSPAWSPDGTRVAFQSNLSGNFDIWIVNADGSGLHALTSDPAGEIQPAWSPDGMWVAFARLDPAFGTYDIWEVRSEDGSDARNLTDDPANDIRPAWSPDGRRLVFESDRDGNAEVYVLDRGALAASAVNLTEDPFEDTDPTWSPDGTRIAFVSDREIFASQIWTMRPDGSDLTVVPGTAPGDRGPAFSPDGTAIAFTRNGSGGIEGIWRVALDGSGPAVLDEASPFTREADWQPVPTEVENLPPVAFAGPDGEIPCAGPEGAVVRLDGSGSSDPDSTAGTNDDIVVYEWFVGFGTTDERRVADTAVAEVTLPPGTHHVALRVTDRQGLTDLDEAVWTIVEAEPVNLDVEVTPSVLWPPNHRLIPIHASLRVSGGTCGKAAEVVLVSAESSESDDAPGLDDDRSRGDIAGAEIGTADFDVLLRAERDGTGPGRTYTLTWAIVEGPAAGTSVRATVVVPHDAAEPPLPESGGGDLRITPPSPPRAQGAPAGRIR